MSHVVTTVGQIAIGDLFSGYCEQIERLIGEANYRDAFANLQDFIRDFSPGKKRNVLALCSRYHRWREAQSLGLPEPDNINVLVHACLDLVDDVRRDFPANGGTIEPDRPVGMVASEQEVIGSAQLIDVTPHRPATTVPAVALPAMAASAESRGNGLTLEQSRHNYFNNWRKTQHADNFVVFQCRDLSRKYEQGSFRLGPISLELRAGEITAIVGRNASGKTTFLRLVNGELQPDAGHLTYPMLQSVGDDWLKIKSKVAFVPQLPERWHGRLRNNLNFVAATYGARGVANQELVDWQLARYGLQEYENAQWDQISGGYKIRFELARALIAQPKLLLLDEPLAYLDVITRQRFLIDLRAIASSLENPIPIVVTSQHLYEIEAIADQLVILDDGKCAFAGRLEDIAKSATRVVIEISLRAAKSDVVECMQDFALQGIEETIEGFILVLPDGTSHEALFSALRRRFGSELYSYRDISRSTRSLMCETPTLAGVLARNPQAEAENAAVRV